MLLSAKVKRRGKLRILTTLGFTGIAMLGIAALANAQVAESFRDLQASLHGGERLRITDKTGVMTNGTLVAFSDESLRLLVEAAGPMDVSAPSIARVERVTPRARRGALVGLLGGAAAGTLWVAMTPECEGFCVGPSKGEAIVPVAGILGGIGAGIGALIGAAKPGHRLVYRAAGATTAAPSSSVSREQAGVLQQAKEGAR